MLAPYKYPREVKFLDELPRTATGKIQRYRPRGNLSYTASELMVAAARRVAGPETVRKVCLYRSTVRSVSPVAEGFAAHLGARLPCRQAGARPLRNP